MSRLHNDVAESIVFVPAELDDAGLSAAEFRVYCHLARRCGQGGAWPSIGSIASTCRLHEDTVRVALRTLHGHGMLTRTERPGATPIYRLTLPRVWGPLRNEGGGSVSYPSENRGGDPSLRFGGDPSEKKGDEGTPLKVLQRRNNTPLPPQPVDRVDREVEEVYAAYPRKVGKGQAVRAIRSAMKLVGFELLLASVQAFADVVATWPESDRQFVPYPATWFNGRRWEDDRSTWARHRNPSDQRQASRPAERPAWVLQKIAGLRESLSAAERDLRIQVAQREHGNPCAEPERAQREVERIKSEILKLGEQP